MRDPSAGEQRWHRARSRACGAAGHRPPVRAGLQLGVRDPQLLKAPRTGMEETCPAVAREGYSVCGGVLLFSFTVAAP